MRRRFLPLVRGAAATGRYVAAEGAGASPLIANRTAIGSWERFDLLPV